ncbi:hypothetical protein [Desulfosporosinus sp. Sb-LF]
MTEQVGLDLEQFSRHMSTSIIPAVQKPVFGAMSFPVVLSISRLA